MKLKKKEASRRDIAIFACVGFLALSGAYLWTAKGIEAVPKDTRCGGLAYLGVADQLFEKNNIQVECPLVINYLQCGYYSKLEQRLGSDPAMSQWVQSWKKQWPDPHFYQIIYCDRGSLVHLEVFAEDAGEARGAPVSNMICDVPAPVDIWGCEKT